MTHYWGLTHYWVKYINPPVLMFFDAQLVWGTVIFFGHWWLLRLNTFCEVYAYVPLGYGGGQS